MAAVVITRTDLDAAGLRAAAKGMSDPRQLRRALALAMVLEGFSRADAARACGMDRQSLRDWVHRYNRAGLAGLADAPRSGRPPCLSAADQAEVSDWVEKGADLATDGVVRFRRVDLRDRVAQHFRVYLHESTIGRMLRRLDFRRITTRPIHPQTDLDAQEAFKKTSPNGRARRWARRGLAARSRFGSRTRPGSGNRGA